MIDLGDLLILRPLWILAVPLALLGALLLARRSDGSAAWARVIDPQLLVFLQGRGMIDPASRSARPWLIGTSAVLLALGLSGPATRRADAPVFRNLDVIMILMDLSPSIIQGGSLDDAQAAVSRLLDVHGTRPVALAVYAGESFLVSVPVEETASLQTAVGAIDAETMPVTGSRPDRALALARGTLADAAAESADVVLVTDGGALGPDALSEARLLQAAGARVSAVQIIPQNAPYGMTPADPDGLNSLAAAGGGIVVTPDDLQPLLKQLNARQSQSQADITRRSVLYRDQGRWIVALACLALLPLFRRRRVA
ncbi:vWA domain-containing protein [Puniceibacterium sediminis]|uniref:Ca-activated chloride channel family protein n=1 Tax=Puniceibacterium sediminis TaxID=1608407 RepID=A0A238YXZ6_9RHOB|nr:vWA domain-containing protein [Puniceibacterium sediminis]SNR75930.1 Ca-activated chloride channel family protein [Puniceibacterium sediminis]